MKKIKFIYEDSDDRYLLKKKKNKYNKIKTLSPYFRSIFIYIIILIFIFMLVTFVFFWQKKMKKENQNQNQKLTKIDIIDKIDSQEFNKIKEFIDIIINGQFNYLYRK